MTIPPNAPAYTSLAAVYDRWQETYSIEYGKSIFPKLNQTFRRYQLLPSHILDLGCGTGTVAILLAREGWTVVGVDVSKGMIAEARRKAAAAGLEILFVEEDLRALSPARGFNAAISLYDVFNHLGATEDLYSAFSGVHRVLLKGGLLIFDVNNARGYHRLWRDQETLRHQDFTMVLDNAYDASLRRAVSRVRVTFNDGREVLEETIVQKYFQEKEIRSALDAVGFDVLEVEDFAFPSAPGAGKLKTWWVARAA